MEATFLGYELDIVARHTVDDPPPAEYRRPRPRPLDVAMYEAGLSVGWVAGYVEERYRYVGMGIYRRVS